MYIRLLRYAGYLLQHRVWMTDIWCGQCFMTFSSHAFYVMDELTIADDYSKFSSQEYYQTLLMIHLINSNREAIEVTTTTNIFGEHPCSIILIPITLLPALCHWLTVAQELYASSPLRRLPYNIILPFDIRHTSVETGKSRSFYSE